MRTLPLLFIPAAALGANAHALRASPNTTPRHLQNGNVNIVEYCGQCIWSGNIVCEARAQFLVREYGDLTLEEARVSILDKCTDDGSDKVVISLDAYCGECPWLAMNFNCDQRVAYLTQTYLLSTEQAQAATVEKGECIDPNYVPESLREVEPEPEEESGGLSTGAIVGIVVGIILALLLCLLVLWVLSRKRNEKDEKKADEISEVVAVPLGGGDTKGGEEVPPEEAPAPAKKRKDRSSKGVSWGMSKPDPDGDTGYTAADDYVAPPKEETPNDTDKGAEQVAEAAADKKNEATGDPPSDDAGEKSMDNAGDEPDANAAEEAGSPDAEEPAGDPPKQDGSNEAPSDSAKVRKDPESF